MQDPTPDILSALGVIASKLAPGIAGSIVALRGMPEGSTFGDRVWSFVGGSAASYYVAPALHEFAGGTSDNVFAILAFAVGAFGLVVCGEISRAIREVELPALVRAWIKTKLGG